MQTPTSEKPEKKDKKKKKPKLDSDFENQLWDLITRRYWAGQTILAHEPIGIVFSDEKLKQQLEQAGIQVTQVEKAKNTYFVTVKIKKDFLVKANKKKNSESKQSSYNPWRRRYDKLKFVGKGGFGSVSLSDKKKVKTVENSNQASVEDRNKKTARAFKRINKEPEEDINQWLDSIYNELKFNQRSSPEKKIKYQLAASSKGLSAVLFLPKAEGKSLSEAINDNPHLDIRLDMALKSTLAVNSLKALGIVSNDIKLGNLIYDSKKGVTVVDFGFAQEIGKPQMRKGTSIYMPPEKRPPIKSQSFSSNFKKPTLVSAAPSIDVYSLGVTLAIIFGYVPEKNDYLTSEDKDAIKQQVKRNLLSLNMPDALINELLEQVIMPMLDEDPEKRPVLEDVIPLLQCLQVWQQIVAENADKFSEDSSKITLYDILRDTQKKNNVDELKKLLQQWSITDPDKYSAALLSPPDEKVSSKSANNNQSAIPEKFEDFQQQASISLQREYLKGLQQQIYAGFWKNVGLGFFDGNFKVPAGVTALRKILPEKKDLNELTPDEVAEGFKETTKILKNKQSFSLRRWIGVTERLDITEQFYQKELKTIQNIQPVVDAAADALNPTISMK